MFAKARSICTQRDSHETSSSNTKTTMMMPREMRVGRLALLHVVLLLLLLLSKPAAHRQTAERRLHPSIFPDDEFKCALGSSASPASRWADRIHRGLFFVCRIPNSDISRESASIAKSTEWDNSRRKSIMVSLNIEQACILAHLSTWRRSRQRLNVKPDSRQPRKSEVVGKLKDEWFVAHLGEFSRSLFLFAKSESLQCLILASCSASLFLPLRFSNRYWRC